MSAEGGHTVTIEATSTPVTVSIGGRVVADTATAFCLHETGLPDRWYLPRSDVDWSLLVGSVTATRCRYKGDAVYWSAELPGGGLVTDVVWACPDPIEGVPELADLVSFYEERPEVTQVIGGTGEPNRMEDRSQ